MDRYPSRENFISSDAIKRSSPVYWGELNVPSSGISWDQYEKKGYLILKNLIDLDKITQVQKDLGRNETTKELLRITEKKSGSTRTVYDVDEKISLSSSDEVPLKLANQILGGDVYLFQSRVNFKNPFTGKDFFWHSDFETWHTEDGMPEMRCITMLIPLEENSEYNAPLMVMPGSHKFFYPTELHTPEQHYLNSLQGSRVGSPKENTIAEAGNKFGIEMVLCKPGDLVIFDCNLLHASASNISPFSRSNLYFVYNSKKNKLTEPFSGGDASGGFQGSCRLKLIFMPPCSC